MQPFRILALNGGGIRGAFGVAFVERLEELTGTNVGEHFDLIAGTSTGAIIAAALAIGLPGRDLSRFYREDGEQIFHPRGPYRARGWMRPIYPVASRVLRRRTGQGMDSFFRARYCPHRLQDALGRVFGRNTLGDIRSSRVIIPTVNLSLGQAKVFRTPHLPHAVGDRDIPIVDVLRAATAAPTYFPHKVMPDGHAYCDGGLWANAPAVVALGESVRIRELCTRPQCDPPHDSSGVRLLAIGTGRAAYSLTPPGDDAGLLYWASRIADVMMLTQMQGVQLPMEFALGERYLPVDFDLPHRSWTLDAVQHIGALMEMGRRAAEAHVDRIRDMFLDAPTMRYVPFKAAA